MYRNIRVSSLSDKAKPQAIVVGLFKTAKPKLPPGYAQLDQQLDADLSRGIAQPEFSPEPGSVTTLYHRPASGGSAKSKISDTTVTRVYVLGLGERDSFTAQVLRIAAAKLVRLGFSGAVRHMRLDLNPGLEDRLDPDSAGRAFADGMMIGNFRFESFLGTGQQDTPTPKAAKDLTILADASHRKGIERSLTVGVSVELARTLAATPPNIANPEYLIDQCRKLARRVGLKCSVIDAKRAKQLKLNGLLAVGAAGSTPPALICLEHFPPAQKSNKAFKRGPVMLVGKAVTFDTGGYSLKPPASMDGMKYDKCGGMAVIGAMAAVAELKIPQHVVALIPTAENMVDEKAYRPGDILNMHNGVTVEVTNTDAEGRLILADALSYGTKKYNPRAVIDLATLTGGVVVALGSFSAGVFANDDKLCESLVNAGSDTEERLWRLPLWEEHRKLIKGSHSDIVNSGGREAHAIQGAAFLSYFVDAKSPTALPKLPWAHLDIAGVADVKEGQNPLFLDKGPTGFGVRLLVRALENMK